MSKQFYESFSELKLRKHHSGLSLAKCEFIWITTQFVFILSSRMLSIVNKLTLKDEFVHESNCLILLIIHTIISHAELNALQFDEGHGWHHRQTKDREGVTNIETVACEEYVEGRHKLSDNVFALFRSALTLSQTLSFSFIWYFWLCLVLYTLSLSAPKGISVKIRK